MRALVRFEVLPLHRRGSFQVPAQLFEHFTTAVQNICRHLQELPTATKGGAKNLPAHGAELFRDIHAATSSGSGLYFS